MKKAKKPLTVKQKQKKYRALQYTCVGGEYVSVLTPFITLGIINADQWFTTQEGYKIGIGSALALALLGICVWLVTKKKEDKTITNGWITLVIGYWAVTFIFILFNSIIDQMATILAYGGIGMLGAAGLDIASSSFKKKADAYKKVLGKVEEESLEDKAKRELEEEQANTEDDGTSI